MGVANTACSGKPCYSFQLASNTNEVNASRERDAA
jgi:hypothetical protein